jgi:hypothetical protein
LKLFWGSSGDEEDVFVQLVCEAANGDEVSDAETEGHA